MPDNHCDTNPSGWLAAMQLLEQQWSGMGRIDHLLEEAQEAPVAERARTRRLVFGALRHRGRIESVLAGLMSRPARPRVVAVLHCAGAELLSGGPDTPPGPVIHHAVNMARQVASPSEAGMVNAVLRRAVPRWNEGEPEGEKPAAWAMYYSHPEWLVRRWCGQFGAAETRELLRWNQSVPPVHARACAGWDGASPPPGFAATPWRGFWRVEDAPWVDVVKLLSEGKIYLQDPGTRLAPAALAVRPGEQVLDLCAAPGGKTLLLAEALAGSGVIVAVDRPGARMERLRVNLRSHHLLDVRTLGADLAILSRQALAKMRLPETYGAVLLDVPCSNTGVLRHRMDVKWRLRPGDFIELPRLQKAFLEKAASLVAPGGRLVYSTCSIDSAENHGVVEAFLASPPGASFGLVSGAVSLPWQAGHDGAGVFLLVRRPA